MRSKCRNQPLPALFLIRYSLFMFLLLFGIFVLVRSSNAASWRDVWSPQQQLKYIMPQYEHDMVQAYPASNDNFRIWVQPEYFNGPISRVRLRLQATPRGDITYAGSSICEKAGSGNPWNCTTDPVKITFSGHDGITVPANQELFSDEIAGFTLEASKNYLINYYVTGHAVYFWHHGASASDNLTRYLWWIHEQGNQTMTKILPSMYVDDGWLTKIYGVEAIQGYTDPQTIRAASVTQDDVQTALNKAADGDTVEVPVGTATWPSTVYMSRGNTLKGQGANTVITPLTLAVNMTSNHPGIRLSNLTFTGGPSDGRIVSVYSWNPAFRIDHNQFINQNYAPVEISAQGFLWRPFGVVDANLFQGHSGYVRVFSDDYPEWDRPDNFGSAELVYIENNQYVGDGNSVVTDGDYGGRFVFRYNDTTNSGVHAHAMGQGTSPAPTGGTAIRQTEIYNNDFVADNFYRWGGFVYIGGGA